MKTLDEVIKALDLCTADSTCHNDCPYFDDDCAKHGMEKDALHYLKEYRDYSKVVDERYAEIEKKQSDAYFMWVNAMAEFERNEPLKWDELRQMEGKPVWVEFLNDEENWNGEWCLVESSDNLMCEILRCQKNWWGLRKNTLGKTWQAYRKERE